MPTANSRPDAPAAHRGGWRAGSRLEPVLTLALIVAGGVAGALARQGLWVVFPRHPDVFDWTTLGINVGGSFLLGALMTVAKEARGVHRRTAPLLGTGVIGGFTTFSTCIVEAQELAASGAPLTALTYLALTLAAALLAVFGGIALARLILRRLGSVQGEES
jgi:CrcB protein